MILVPPAGYGDVTRVDYEPTRSMGKPHILIAVANTALRRRLTYALRFDGYEVASFASGDELARNLVRHGKRRRRQPPHLIVLDEWSATEAELDAMIDAQHAHDVFPVLVLGATPLAPAIDERALQVGAVFHPPFDLGDIRSAVAHMIPEVMP